MNKETLDLVNKLAEKLGTTVDQLWLVLIKQARVEVITSLASIVLVWMILIAAFVVLYKNTKTPPATEENKYPEPKWSDEWSFIPWCFWGVFTVIAAFYSVDEITNSITTLMNPEYWALTQILNRI
jgi:hypothetical protein